MHPQPQRYGTSTESDGTSKTDFIEIDMLVSLSLIYGRSEKATIQCTRRQSTAHSRTKAGQLLEGRTT